jgi:signal peptidase I
MNEYLNKLVNDYKCPLINSFIFSNGDLLVVENFKFGNNNKIRILCKSSIKSYFDYNEEEDVSYFDILSKDENETFIVYGGEGSSGGDGILYVIDKRNNQLLWFLFLDNSNPFIKVSIVKDEIVAYTTYDKEWKFPIFSPCKVSIYDIKNR